MLSSCTFFGGMDQSKSKVFDWENSGALDFLNYLCDYESNFYTVSSTYENWIKETDLPKLIERLDSSEPCANVAATSSSFIDKNRSTAGNEAAYLIMGYRSGKYPPNLNSTRPKPDIAEIKSWWNDQKSP